MKARRVAVLGSTGSIGRQALKVIASQPEWSACALAANGNSQLLLEQAAECRPQYVAISRPQADAASLRKSLPEGVTLLVGSDAMTEAVRLSSPDVLLNGVVGAAGLKPTLQAIDMGRRVALANKETLVLAGAIVMPRARKKNAEVLPVDSEHSAIFQCLQAGRRSEVRRVVLTASGGALRDWDPKSAAQATVADALKHPTWQMGRKITIDSATLMNKALEIIEAHWLFDLSSDQIDVVIHPESVIHSFVEYRDGSVIAQMGMPDMCMPISYALGYPDRQDRQVPPLDLAHLGKLTFRPPTGRFARPVELAREVIRLGGIAGAVLNAANESAVEAFLQQKISMGQVVPMVEEVLHDMCPSASGNDVTLESLLDADAQARRQVTERLAAKNV